MVAKRLAEHPFRAPEADELRALGLGRRELAAAVRLGRLTAIAEGVVLGPDVAERAVEELRRVPQPFSVWEARTALGSTRRVIALCPPPGSARTPLSGRPCWSWS